jgi:hypothetical protein
VKAVYENRLSEAIKHWILQHVTRPLPYPTLILMRRPDFLGRICRVWRILLTFGGQITDFENLLSNEYILQLAEEIS